MNVVKCEILSNIKVSERYWHMVVDSSKIESDIQPGQFFNLKCGDSSYPFLRRPFSIYRINKKEKTIEFLYLITGLGSKELTNYVSGDYLDVFGPLGEGFSLKEDWDTIILLARGVGIATLAALAQEASQRGIKSIAILSARSNNDLLATETLQALGAEVYKVTEEAGNSDVEQVEELLTHLFDENDIKAGFTCGSKRLSKLLKKMTEERSIPGQIALEEHMGCAMGVCYACVCDIKDDEGIKSVRVCKEGPVFTLDEVILS